MKSLGLSWLNSVESEQVPPEIKFKMIGLSLISQAKLQSHSIGSILLTSMEILINMW